MSEAATREPHRLIAATVGVAIPRDRELYGYLSEHHSFGESEDVAGDYAEELAARDALYFAERVASAIPQPAPADTTVIAFGSQVTILRDDGRRQTFRIVGEDEADPRGGSIAYVSPLAHRLIGKRVGETIEMDGREIEVVAIE